MRTKIVFLLMAVIFSVVICTGCIDWALPVYEKTETEEDGICVVIDGVKYKQLPETKWNANQYGEIIGYAGNRDLSVSMIKGDTNRYFMFLHGFWDEMYILYREDIPEPSSENVDKLMWTESVIDSDERYSSTITDKEVINELFKVLDSGEKTTEYNMLENDTGLVDVYISCSSSEVTGAVYVLNIGSYNGKLICGSRYEKIYTEIPKDLLEKIAGKQIDVKEALPVYERGYEGGISVAIDGVTYSQLPYLSWKVDTNGSKKIGYAGVSRIYVMDIPEDTERNFVFLKDYSSEPNYDNYCLRRTDKDLPDVDAQSVDKIVWKDNITGSTYTNIIEDKKTIEDLFLILYNSMNESEYTDDNPATYISIKLYCSDLPGAYFPLNLGLYNNRIVCEDVSRTNTVYLPFSLLEKIAGKKLEGILY